MSAALNDHLNIWLWYFLKKYLIDKKKRFLNIIVYYETIIFIYVFICMFLSCVFHMVNYEEMSFLKALIKKQKIESSV